MQKVRANIYLEHIRHNAAVFASLTKRKLCAVVKANAYGHGAEEVASALEGLVDFFAVALIEEGISIRSAACGKDVLVFTPPTDEEEVYTLAVNGFIASVGSVSAAKLVIKTCERYQIPLRVHLKINTGMNRYGLAIEEMASVCAGLRACAYVQVCGIYTHLCECNIERARKQTAMLSQAIEVCKAYFSNVTAHLGGTYAALLGEEFLFDAVRIGLGLYGYMPCACNKLTGVLQPLPLRKGMTVCAKSVAQNSVFHGGFGYGEEIPRQEAGTEISVLRFGYADGFLRRRENGVDGWQNNANTLCMDVCLRKGRAEVGAWQTVLSDAEETARRTGTIPYEVLCAATRRAELIYDDERYGRKNKKD